MTLKGYFSLFCDIFLVHLQFRRWLTNKTAHTCLLMALKCLKTQHRYEICFFFVCSQMRVEFEEDAVLTPVYESLFEGFAKCMRRRQTKQNSCIDDVLNKIITQDLHMALTVPFHGYTIKGSESNPFPSVKATTHLNRLDIRNWVTNTIIPDLFARTASMKQIDIAYAPCLHRAAFDNISKEDTIDDAWNGRQSCLYAVHEAQQLALTHQFDLQLGTCVNDCKDVYSNYDNQCVKFKKQWTDVHRLLERKPSIMRLAPRYAHPTDYVPQNRRVKRFENQF